jgi:hypothetical protein
MNAEYDKCEGQDSTESPKYDSGKQAGFQPLLLLRLRQRLLVSGLELDLDIRQNRHMVLQHVVSLELRQYP